MRKWLRRALTVSLGLTLAVIAAAGQTRTYRASRAADGKPNFNGIWQALNEAYWDIEAHAAAPSPVIELGAAHAVAGGLSIIEGGTLPYKPEALAKKQQNYANRLELDPEIKCYLPGVPRANYMPYPFQVIQGPKYIMMIYTYGGAVRTIYMDEHKEAPADSWMGWSNGHWDGDALVVDTTGFNDKTWFDRAGNFHSDALHVTERYTRIDTPPPALTIFSMRRRSRIRTCSRDRGRSACSSTADWKRTPRSWNSGAWNLSKS